MIITLEIAVIILKNDIATPVFKGRNILEKIEQDVTVQKNKDIPQNIIKMNLSQVNGFIVHILAMIEEDITVAKIKGDARLMNEGDLLAMSNLYNREKTKGDFAARSSLVLTMRIKGDTILKSNLDIPAIMLRDILQNNIKVGFLTRSHIAMNIELDIPATIQKAILQNDINLGLFSMRNISVKIELDIARQIIGGIHKTSKISQEIEVGA